MEINFFKYTLGFFVMFFSLEFYGICTCCRKVAILISKPGRFEVATLINTNSLVASSRDLLRICKWPCKGNQVIFHWSMRKYGEEAHLMSNGSKVFLVIWWKNLCTEKYFERQPETPMPIVGWFLCNPYRIHVWYIWSHVPSFAINSAMNHEWIAYAWTQALFFSSLLGCPAGT